MSHNYFTDQIFSIRNVAVTKQQQKIVNLIKLDQNAS